MHILIDGYNLLHAIGFRGNLAEPGQLERARMEMLDKLAAYLKLSERRKTIVVFDQGRRRKDKPQRYERHEIRVEFATGFDDADTMIESIIQGHAVPQKLLVVSSDHRIQSAARRRKAEFVDSDDWIDQLEHPSSPPPRKKESGGKPKFREDSEYWLKLFETVDLEFSPEEAIDSLSTQSDFDSDVEPLADSDEEEAYNPFPEGYGEDLLDME